MYVNFVHKIVILKYACKCQLNLALGPGIIETNNHITNRPKYCKGDCVEVDAHNLGAFMSQVNWARLA